LKEWFIEACDELLDEMYPDQEMWELDSEQEDELCRLADIRSRENFSAYADAVYENEKERRMEERQARSEL